MSKEISTGIMATYNATPALSGLAKMWTPWAPENQVAPFITFVCTGGRTDGSMDPAGIAYIERVPVQFTVFVEEWKLDNGWDIIKQLKVAYDNNLLGGTLSDGTRVIICKRMSNGLVVDQPEGGFGIVLDYEYTVQR